MDQMVLGCLVPPAAVFTVSLVSYVCIVGSVGEDGSGATKGGQEAAEAHTAWSTYAREDSAFTYTVEYPSAWSYEEEGRTTRFHPPGSQTTQEGRVAIVVYDLRETPPPPVGYTYETLRTVQTESGSIPVQARTPSPATVLYMASVEEGGYTAEFRFSLKREYDEVFDHMLATFTMKAR